jgi:hypothetical protein
MIKKVDKRGYLSRHSTLLVKDIKQEAQMLAHATATRGGLQAAVLA